MRTDTWMRGTAIMAGLIFATFEARTASAQSLADIARLEAERRNQQIEGKSYTNEDLDAVPPPETQTAIPPAATHAPVAPPPVTKPSGVVIQEDPTKGTLDISTPGAPSTRDEKYWRKRSRDMRENLARVRANIASNERRLAVLDDSPQTPAVTRERQAVVTALKELRSEETMRNQDMAQLKTFAAGQKVPPAWLELE